MATQTRFLVLCVAALLCAAEAGRRGGRRKKNRATRAHAKRQLWLVFGVIALSVLPVLVWGLWTLARDPALPYVARRGYNWCVKRAFGSLGVKRTGAKRQQKARSSKQQQQRRRPTERGERRMAGAGGSSTAAKQRPGRRAAKSVGWKDPAPVRRKASSAARGAQSP